MGFSSALQGRSAHEAILARQDAELRLMEIMKRCLLQKAKYDKEYSVALAAVTQQGNKIDRADELQGSHIIKAWKVFMDELEQTGKQFKSNAELLENICQEKLAQLYQEKRKARKAYQEEHSRISTQFNQLADEVSRKKSEYQKQMEYYKLLRSRFEEHYIKSGRGGRKLDEVRDKYQKACRKLHQAHNEYVLIINEAIEVEKDYRTCLLPGLLEHQQLLQENFIQIWRSILQESIRCGDLTSEKFREIQKQIEISVQNISPAEEYREFTDKHKTTPTPAVHFQFDDTLIEDSLGKLQPNTLAVDNLTIDWLRSRLSELETSVKECQEKQSKLTLENGTPTTPILTNGNGISGIEGNKFSKDLNSLRCQERQMLKLAEIIKTALNEIGCEELPSGCDDISVGQSFIENNVGNDQSNSTSTVASSSYILQKGAEVISIIKAPFKRKSCPPTTPERTPRSRRHKSPDTGSLGSSVNSLATSSKNSFAKIESNLYVDIDNNETNSLILNCENNINALTNSFDNSVSTDQKNEGDNENEEKSEIFDSKNNLLVCLENPSDLIESSVETHIDSLDKINKKIDEKLKKDEVDEEKINIKELEIPQIINTSSTKSIKNKIKQKIGLGTGASSSSSYSETERNKLIDSKGIDKNEIININENLNPEKNLENEIKDLEKLIEDTDRDIKKKSNKKRKKKKKGENFKKELDECSLKEELVDKNNFSNEKKVKTFSNRSMNAFFSSIREFKSYKNSQIESTKLTNFEPEPEPEIEKLNEDICEEKDFTKTITELNNSNNEIDNENEIFFTELDTNEIVSSQTNVIPSSSSSSSTSTVLSKFRSAKFKETLKKKLNFNKEFKSSLVGSNKKGMCKNCSKPNRKIHPSHTVLDFEREFQTDKLFKYDEDNFCVCDDFDDDDDCLTIKNHDYNDKGITISTNRPLSAEDWFHGVLPREEVVRLLRNEGDFLVRQTTRNDESQIVLSVCWNGHKHFIVQTTAEGHYRFEGPAFPSIQELILHQYQSELPVTGRSGAILKKFIPRETWELSNDDVIPLEKIGRGNFGDVYKARLKSTKLEVAVKTCRMTLPEEQKRKFLQEGRILKQYDHPNIVKLIGICVQKQPIMIVMELVGGGSLLNFLRKNATTLTVKQLMGMCRDAAAGMRYLESKNCIHRDLAARNCLIGYENIVKISDFGMSREEEEYIVSDGMKQIPIKWTAPEALNFGKYTSLCDVWSYGVLMWEIFSKGDTPYSGMSNARARERIDAGYRMPAPENTPNEMYRLMLRCWSYESEARPHFDEIYMIVDKHNSLSI